MTKSSMKLNRVYSIIYATQTHPDIQFSVNLIAHFSGNPGIPHLEAAKHILHYLKGTQEFSLVLGCQGRGTVILLDGLTQIGLVMLTRDTQ